MLRLYLSHIWVHVNGISMRVRDMREIQYCFLGFAEWLKGILRNCKFYLMEFRSTYIFAMFLIY